MLAYRASVCCVLFLVAIPQAVSDVALEIFPTLMNSLGGGEGEI